LDTVFSHIIQKRFSQVNEDVATDALAFILGNSEAAREGFLKLLRGLVEDVPDLRFRTQQTEGNIRPDLWGFAGTTPRVFVENKFWAGLTENQPVSYIKQLAKYSQPTVLLVIAPEARETILWRELKLRVKDSGIKIEDSQTGAGIVFTAKTDAGPILALTSWSRLLSNLERETTQDLNTKGDLQQLRALCNAADTQAFVPFSREILSDQVTPAFILQLADLVQASVDQAVSKGILSIDGLRPMASWDG
jgi:hypothetical protein